MRPKRRRRVSHAALAQLRALAVPNCSRLADSMLIATCAEFLTLDGELEDRVEACKTVEADPQLDAVLQFRFVCLSNIMATKALTMHGLMAKAAALKAYIIKTDDGEPANRHDLLAWSLANDILAFGAGESPQIL